VTLLLQGFLPCYCVVENAKYHEFFKKSNSGCIWRRTIWGVIASTSHGLDCSK
jgi:hypothetical protein